MTRPLHLTILHSNDVHGRVHQLSRIATRVRQIRQEVQESGSQCLYLDAGDSEDTTLVESALSRGTTINVLLRAAGCDQAALGNAIPVRYGPQAVESLAQALGKPLLCANLFTPQGDLLPGTTPYQLVDLDGHAIAIIGFTAPMSFYTRFFKYPAYDPIALMPELIARARADGAKTVIALTHIGSKHDIQLAQDVPGIHLIVGGHDHQRISPPMVINNTLIVQSGEYGEMLGRLDLVIDRASGRIDEYSGVLLPIGEEIAENKDVLKAMQEENKRIDRLMNKVIGETRVPLSTSEDQECAAGNLQADALLAHVKGAELALVVTGHWESGLEVGRITQKQLFTANRSAGNPALVTLTGAQIRQWLTAALNPSNMASKYKPLRGRCTGMPGIAGMRVVAERARLREMQVFIGEEPMQDDRQYSVAVTDMEISDILNYMVIPDEQAQYEVPIILPEIIEEYIISHSPINTISMGRITLK